MQRSSSKMPAFWHVLFIFIFVHSITSGSTTEPFVKKIILGTSAPSLDDGTQGEVRHINLHHLRRHVIDDKNTVLPLDNDTKDEESLFSETDSPSTNVSVPQKGFHGFFNAFVASVSVIIVSELGDKTFFIAVIFAMNHSRVLVFLGASAALILMTVLSAGLGVVSSVIPRVYVHYISVALFLIFGLKMLKDGYSMTGKEAKEEYEMTQKSIDSRTNPLLKRSQSSVESGVTVKRRSFLLMWVFLEAFIMTFLAEWGDRSQLTTIVLAARENASGVIVGAIVGHVACTLLAVLGGYVAAEKISVRVVTIIGGILFIGFALFAIITGPDSDESLSDSTQNSTATT